MLLLHACAAQVVELPNGLCMPPLSQRFSAITLNDASIGVHNFDGGIAIGGALTEPPNPNPNPAPVDGPSWAFSFGTNTSSTSYHFNSGLIMGDWTGMPTATLSLNFSAFEALVDGLSTGVLRSTNASGFSVHVVDQGGTYSANGLGPTTFHQEIFLGSSAQAYNEGRTLVVFKGAGTVVLTSTPGSTQLPFGVPTPGQQGHFTGSQFGPSVLAPYAHVVVRLS